MPNLLYQSDQPAQCSWIQLSNGEWSYEREANIANEATLPIIAQDYIWLVSPATSAHNISGYRIANETIETFIKQLAGVSQVIAIGVPHEQKGNAIHIYVELITSNIELTTLSEAINAKLAGCFGEFARAELIKYVDQLPEAKNKEISRKILKSQNITMNYAA